MEIVPFALITEAELRIGPGVTVLTPELSSRCVRCARCLATCPPSALRSTARVDPDHCITFHNELEGWVPASIRRAMANRLVGCERCQTACRPSVDLRRPGDPLLYLPDIAMLDEQGFVRRNEQIRREYGVGWRTREGLVRAAAIGLGCSGVKEVAEVLSRLLLDPSPVVRGQAAWAIGNVGAEDYVDGLLALVRNERNLRVLAEADSAIAELQVFWRDVWVNS